MFIFKRERGRGGREKEEGGRNRRRKKEEKRTDEEKSRKKEGKGEQRKEGKSTLSFPFIPLTGILLPLFKLQYS